MLRSFLKVVNPSGVNSVSLTESSSQVSVTAMISGFSSAIRSVRCMNLLHSPCALKEINFNGTCSLQPFMKERDADCTLYTTADVSFIVVRVFVEGLDWAVLRPFRSLLSTLTLPLSSFFRSSMSCSLSNEDRCWAI